MAGYRSIFVLNIACVQSRMPLGFGTDESCVSIICITDGDRDRSIER